MGNCFSGKKDAMNDALEGINQKNYNDEKQNKKDFVKLEEELESKSLFDLLNMERISEILDLMQTRIKQNQQTEETKLFSGKLECLQTPFEAYFSKADPKDDSLYQYVMVLDSAFSSDLHALFVLNMSEEALLKLKPSIEKLDVQESCESPQGNDILKIMRHSLDKSVKDPKVEMRANLYRRLEEAKFLMLSEPLNRSNLKNLNKFQDEKDEEGVVEGFQMGIDDKNLIKYGQIRSDTVGDIAILKENLRRRLKLGFQIYMEEIVRFILQEHDYKNLLWFSGDENEIKSIVLMAKRKLFMKLIRENQTWSDEMSEVIQDAREKIERQEMEERQKKEEMKKVEEEKEEKEEKEATDDEVKEVKDTLVEVINKEVENVQVEDPVPVEQEKVEETVPESIPKPEPVPTLVEEKEEVGPVEEVVEPSLVKEQSVPEPQEEKPEEKKEESKVEVEENEDKEVTDDEKEDKEVTNDEKEIVIKNVEKTEVNDNNTLVVVEEEKEPKEDIVVKKNENVVEEPVQEPEQEPEQEQELVQKTETEKVEEPEKIEEPEKVEEPENIEEPEVIPKEPELVQEESKVAPEEPKVASEEPKVAPEEPKVEEKVVENEDKEKVIEQPKDNEEKVEPVENKEKEEEKVKSQNEDKQIEDEEIEVTELVVGGEGEDTQEEEELERMETKGEKEIEVNDQQVETEKNVENTQNDIVEENEEIKENKDLETTPKKTEENNNENQTSMKDNKNTEETNQELSLIHI